MRKLIRVAVFVFAVMGGSTVASAGTPVVSAVATPGPASLVLLGVGLLAMVGAIRRRVLRT